MRNVKIAVLLTLSLLISSTAVAQPASPGVGDTLSGLINDVDQFLQPGPDINGFLDLMIWVILPIAGLSGLYYWIMYKSLSMAEKRAKENSTYASKDDDLTKKISKLVGIMFGVGTYYYLAAWLFWLFALALIGVIVAWLPWITGLYMKETVETPDFDGFGGGSDGSSDSGDQGSAGGNEEWRQKAQDIEHDIDQMSSQIQNLEGMEGRLENQFNEIRNNLNEVDQETQTVGEELKALAGDVEEIDEFKQRMNNMNLTAEQKQKLSQIIGEVEKVEDLEEHIENNIEEIKQQEEKIEKQEERIAKYERKIEELETQVINEFNERIREIENIEMEQEEISDKLDKLEKEVSQGEMDRKVFSDEIQEIFSLIEDLEGKVDHESNKISNLEMEVSKIAEFLSKIMEGQDPEDLESLAEKIKKMAERTEDEAGKTKEVKDKEEDEVNNLPAKIENVFGKSINEESQIINQEVYELSEEEDILGNEEEVIGLEEDIEKGEITIEKEMEKELKKLMHMLYGLSKAVEEDKKRTRMLKEGEADQHRVHEMEINDIRDELISIRRGNTQMSATEVETFAQKTLEKMDQLQKETEDRSTVQHIRETRTLAQKILKKYTEGEKDIKQDHKILEQQDQERKALMSGESGKANRKEYGNLVLKQVNKRLEIAKNTDFTTFGEVRQFWADNQSILEEFQSYNDRLGEQQRNEIGDKLHELQKYLENEAEKHGGSLGGSIV